MHIFVVKKKQNKNRQITEMYTGDLKCQILGCDASSYRITTNNIICHKDNAN